MLIWEYQRNMSWKITNVAILYKLVQASFLGSVNRTKQSYHFLLKQYYQLNLSHKNGRKIPKKVTLPFKLGSKGWIIEEFFNFFEKFSFHWNLLSVSIEVYLKTWRPWSWTLGTNTPYILISNRVTKGWGWDFAQNLSNC